MLPVAMAILHIQWWPFREVAGGRGLFPHGLNWCDIRKDLALSTVVIIMRLSETHAVCLS